MCVAFDKLSVYQYAFAPDEREDFDFEALSELSYADIASFQSFLTEAITSYQDKNSCFKYIYFEGFDTTEDMLSSDGMILFVDAVNKIVCLQPSALRDIPEKIETRYSKAYDNEGYITAALRDARKKLRDWVSSRDQDAVSFLKATV